MQKKEECEGKKSTYIASIDHPILWRVTEIEGYNNKSLARDFAPNGQRRQTRPLPIPHVPITSTFYSSRATGFPSHLLNK